MLVTWAWLALAVAAVVPAGAMYYDGNQLVALTREYEKCDREPKGCDFIRVGVFTGFVTGVSDSRESDYCPAAHIPVHQVCTIVVKYLSDHAEEWNMPAHVLVMRALKQAFPCEKAK